jgi:hypothetical protein
VKNSKQQDKFKFSTIGRKKIITVPTIEANDLFISFPENREEIKIADVEVYLIDEGLLSINNYSCILTKLKKGGGFIPSSFLLL